MTFSEINVGDRFSNAGFPNGRLYQKVSHKHAVDLSEGPDVKGFYVRDAFSLTFPVVLRNECPGVNPLGYLPGEE
jgi:hypothetical protein